MSGILFLGTRQLASVVTFYRSRLGCELWLDQSDCSILRHDNFLFGFCERDRAQSNAMLTFWFESRADVDRMYEAMRDLAQAPPAFNEKYRIYQFFAQDPEGRAVEIQCFDHPVAAFRSGDKLLLTRRSIRRYEDRPVPVELLGRVLELSRFAPTARNTQPYYFKMIRDRETIAWLSALRESSTQPIARAPMAVAIGSDPSVSTRHIQDGCIAAYHFMLAAWFHGLGTCWIAAMDRDDVKARLDIPLDHYVVTVTPLGFPAGEHPEPHERKPVSWFQRYGWE